MLSRDHQTLLVLWESIFFPVKNKKTNSEIVHSFMIGSVVITNLVQYFQNCAVQVKIELGHRATVKKTPSPNGFTHDWTVYVRGPENCNISYFIEKVVFNLHGSFHNPKRGIVVCLIEIFGFVFNQGFV